MPSDHAVKDSKDVHWRGPPHSQGHENMWIINKECTVGKGFYNKGSCLGRHLEYYLDGSVWAWGKVGERWYELKTKPLCVKEGGQTSFLLSEIRFGCIVWLGSLVGFIPNEDKNFTELLALISLIWCSQTIEEGTTTMAEMVLYSVVI